MKRLTLFALLIGLCVGIAALPSSPTVAAEDENRPIYQLQPLDLDTRSFSTRDGQPLQTVTVPNAQWLRLIVGEHALQPTDRLIIRSLLDGSEQRHSAETLAQWSNRSAYFNGDTVEIQLEGAESSYVRFESMMVGEQFPHSRESSTICGSDNRAPSTDNRVGRLTFVNAAGNPTTACTIWSTATGAMLTAGHCVDFDPDRSGPLLPDGNHDLDANDVVEFNVPLSTATGALQFAAADDQYALDLDNIDFGFDGSGQGLGKDWGILDVQPNPNTGLLPRNAYGWFRMTRDRPNVDNTIRITGYGTDSSPNNTRNQIQQTDTGTYEGESSSGSNFWHSYRVDTTGGNSGSPIIWESNQYTIGIHTNGGCTSTGTTSANTGTSFEHSPLENELDHFYNLFAHHVDRAHRNRTANGNGAPFEPFPTVSDAINFSDNFGHISIVTGNYNETMIIDKPKLLVAPVGSVIIGE